MMSKYHAFSGDDDGVVIQPDGKTFGKCPDGYFWLAPSCRSDETKCVLYLTGGSGYGLGNIMQKSSKLKLPMGLGIALSWSTLPSQFKSTFYWYLSRDITTW